MGEPKKAPTDAERIAKLESQLHLAMKLIERMEKMGGFTDAKTLGIRCTRIEERLALVELDGEMLKDCTAHVNEMMADHLGDRHGEDIDRGDSIDVRAWRRARRRLREWAEKRGLMTRRRDVTDTRRDENRARPREAMPA